VRHSRTALRDVGIGPTEIVRVLDATGLEPFGTDAEAARQRVNKRIRRARATRAQGNRGTP